MTASSREIAGLFQKNFALRQFNTNYVLLTDNITQINHFRIAQRKKIRILYGQR